MCTIAALSSSAYGAFLLRAPSPQRHSRERSREKVFPRVGCNKINDEMLAVLDSDGLEAFLRFVLSNVDCRFDIMNTTTALHRLAKWWSSCPSSAKSPDKSREAIVLLSHRFVALIRETLRDEALGSFYYSDLQPRHVSIAAWACATLSRAQDLGVRATAMGMVFSLIAEVSTPRVARFDAQSLGNLLWACAVVRQIHRRLFFVAAKRAVAMIETAEMRGQNLSNVVWAFSQARLPNRALFKAVAASDPWQGEYSSQHITNTLWSFSRIHGKIGMFREFFDRAALAAIPKLHTFKTQELGNIVWTFANQSMHHEMLFAAVAAHARGRLHEFGNFDFSQLLWSFAKVWWRDEGLFQEAARELIDRGRHRTMYAQDLGCVLWAFAMVQWPDLRVFQVLADATRAQIHTLKPLDFGNIAWALGVSGQLDLVTARSITEHMLYLDVALPLESSGGQGGFSATADGWIHVLSAVEPFRFELGECWERLESRFTDLIFSPLCRQLSGLWRHGADECSEDLSREPHDIAPVVPALPLAVVAVTAEPRVLQIRHRMALLEQWVNELMLEHLGPHYTAKLATASGISRDVSAQQEPWLDAARSAVSEYAAADPRYHAQSGFGGEAFRVGLHQSKVLAWLFYELRIAAEPPRVLTEPGLVVAYGRADLEYCALWQAAERLLQPVITSHARGGHAERVAMLTALQDILKAVAARNGPDGTVAEDGSISSVMDHVSGEVKVYITHWPCISCLAVFCQFAALVPQATLQVSWDGYAGHTEPHAPPKDCTDWAGGGV